MKKFRFVLFDKEEIIEFDDDITESELEKEFDSWIDNNIECFYEKIYEVRMKKEDFKEIKKEHFETCKKIILSKGICVNCKCFECPFNELNLKKEIKCTYYRNQMYCVVEDKKLVESCKEFLKFKEAANEK